MKDLTAQVLALNPQCLTLGEGMMHTLLFLATLEQQIEKQGLAILFDGQYYRVYTHHTKPHSQWLAHSGLPHQTRGNALAEASCLLEQN